MSDLPVPLTQRRRRPHLAEQDLREKMFEAAQELVCEMDVKISLEDLGFEDVIHRAGVPRSSVYRVWPYRGNFVDDLLAYLAGPKRLGGAALDQETINLGIKIVEENQRFLADPVRRRALLQETVRQAVAQNFEAIFKSRDWHIYIALVATARTTRGDVNAVGHTNITNALVRSEVHFVQTMENFYRVMFESFRLRFKYPNVGFAQIATAGAALVEGLALRKVLLEAAVALNSNHLTPEQNDDVQKLGSYIEVSAPGPSLTGGQAEWSLAALAFQGLLDALVEPELGLDAGLGSVGQEET